MPNSLIVVIGLIVLATLFIFMFIGSLFRKAGPNEAIIIYGFRGPRIIKGSGAV